MKFLLLFVLLVFAADLSFAAGPNASDVRNSVGVPVSIDTSSTNITSAAWVTFVATTAWPCSAIMVHNQGGQPIKIGVGAAAAEVDTGTVIPIGVSILLPIVIKKGVRLSLRSIGATQATGYISLACYQ